MISRQQRMTCGREMIARDKKDNMAAVLAYNNVWHAVRKY